MHPFFSALQVYKITSNELEHFFNEEGKKILFLWGNNCPNCEIAKNLIFQDIELIQSLGFKWYHNNVYDDFELSSRFGLHGIPVFLVYKGRKSIGRITSFPGIQPFIEALKKV